MKQYEERQKSYFLNSEHSVYFKDQHSSMVAFLGQIQKRIYDTWDLLSSILKKEEDLTLIALLSKVNSELALRWEHISWCLLFAI